MDRSCDSRCLSKSLSFLSFEVYGFFCILINALYWFCMKVTLKEFADMIRNYAEAYRAIELVQKAETPLKDRLNPFIPKKGDQKTGVFGEALVYEFLMRSNYTNLEFGTPSEKGWDIKGIKDHAFKLIQVKTTSAFAEKRIISPIHAGWDHLYLVSLDKSFIPNGIWLLDDPSVLNWKIENGKKILRSMKMKDPENSLSNGSRSLFNSGYPLIDLIQVFKETMHELYM